MFSILEQFCVDCGLCCNGVIFADVQLQPEDDPARLHELGIEMASISKKIKIKQPCPALCGQCKIYADRPAHCRDFECALFKSLKAGHNDYASALEIVVTAQKRAEKVKKLLRELGETDETLALSKRFQRVKRRMENDFNDETSVDIYALLTLATHELNYLLSEAFYPRQ